MRLNWLLILDKSINKRIWRLNRSRTKTVACSRRGPQRFGSLNPTAPSFFSSTLFGDFPLYFTQYIESGLEFICIIPLSEWLWAIVFPFKFQTKVTGSNVLTAFFSSFPLPGLNPLIFFFSLFFNLLHSFNLLIYGQQKFESISWSFHKSPKMFFT